MAKEPHFLDDQNIIQPNRLSENSVSPSDEQIDAVISELPRGKDFTGNLAFATVACVLGSSFMVGYNSGVLNDPSEVLKNFYNCTYLVRHGSSESIETCLSSPSQFRSNATDKMTNQYMPQSQMTILWGMTVAAFAFGGTFGGVSAGFFASKFGRKGALLRNNLLHLIAAAILIVSRYVKSYEMLIAGRFVIGVCAGIFSGAGPLYLSEISPVFLRGFVGTFYPLAITIGILVAQILGLEQVLGTADLWQILIGLTIVSGILQVLTLSWCPETPQYLMINQHNEEEAEKALIWLRGRVDVSEELEDMRNEMNRNRSMPKFSVGDFLRHKQLIMPLILSVVLQVSQQFSGFNAVTYYSTDIFRNAGLSKDVAQYATLATGGVNVLMTFVSALIVDRAGRRTLLLTGLGFMFIFSLVLILCYIYQEKITWLRYVCVGTVICYMIAFALGPGAIPWFIVAELFSQGPRSVAVSIATMVNWLCNFTVGLVIPELQDYLGNYFFLPFTVMLVLFWILIFIKVPETKGKTIEEITALFDDSVSKQAVIINRKLDQNYERFDHVSGGAEV